MLTLLFFCSASDKDGTNVSNPLDGFLADVEKLIPCRFLDDIEDTVRIWLSSVLFSVDSGIFWLVFKVFLPALTHGQLTSL